MLKGRQRPHGNHHLHRLEIMLVNDCMPDNKKYVLTHDE